jgi:hypothetical protein
MCKHVSFIAATSRACQKHKSVQAFIQVDDGRRALADGHFQSASSRTAAASIRYLLGLLLAVGHSSVFNGVMPPIPLRMQASFNSTVEGRRKLTSATVVLFEPSPNHHAP